jgi:hypothetical protein
VGERERERERERGGGERERERDGEVKNINSNKQTESNISISEFLTKRSSALVQAKGVSSTLEIQLEHTFMFLLSGI